MGLQVGPPSTVKTELVIRRDPDNLILRHILLSIAKAIVFYVCPLSQIVAVPGARVYKPSQLGSILQQQHDIDSCLVTNLLQIW